MIQHYEKRQPWVWRCHIDIKHAAPQIWNFVKPFINRYDGVIVSMDKYKKDDIKPQQHVLTPSIDPLSIKNAPIPPERRRRVLAKRGIDQDRPLITQISRFDPWKDPLGVVKIWQKVKEKVDCQLVLMGDMAADDPEGPVVYQKVRDKVGDDPNVCMITERNDVLVNCLQSDSNVIIQNSIREGFSLTVSEALWKKTPVVATPIGGIPSQVIDGKTGFLIKNADEAAKRCLELINDPALGRKLGENGHEHVKQNFLITRKLEEHIELANYYINKVGQ
jgi:trehalose synthase